MLNLRFYTRSKTRVKRKYDFNTGDFDTGEGGEKNFPFKNFNEREKQRNPADFAVSSRLFIIVRLEDLDIVRSTSVHFVSRVYREEKEKRKRGRIRSVAFGCSSSMERRIIIRGIQPSPPSFLSSILSVGLGLPRVTLSSNGISDPSSSSSFDFTTLASSEYFQRRVHRHTRCSSSSTSTSSSVASSFSSFLFFFSSFALFFPFSTLSRALYVTLRNTERMYIRLSGYAFENLT